MKTGRSRTGRDFLGAACGGTLGILAGWGIHPIALIVGCLVGVVCGFFYVELWLIIMRSFEKSRKIMRQRWNRLPKVKFDQLNWTTCVFGGFCYALGVSVAFTLGMADKLPGCLMRVIELTGRAANHFFNVRRTWFFALRDWLKKSTVNKIFVLRIVTGVVFFTVTLRQSMIYLASQPFDYSQEQIARGVTPLGDILCVSFIVSVSLVLPAIVLVLGQPVTVSTNNRADHALKLIRRYDRYGGFGFVAFDMFLLIRMVVLLLLTYISVFIGALAGMVIGVGVCLPTVMIFMAAIKVMKLTMARRKQWQLCFGVTLMVTGLSFLINYPWMTEITVGFISLGTGLLAGVTVLAARELALVGFKRYSALRRVASRTSEEDLETIMDWTFDVPLTCLGRKYVTVMARMI